MPRDLRVKLPPIGGKWKVQDVTPRQTKCCEVCGKRPKVHRAVWLEECMPFPKSHTFCMQCAVTRSRHALRFYKTMVIAFADHHGLRHGYKLVHSRGAQAP